MYNEIVMSFDVLVKAPAKVNIGLRVLEKRGDGYHGIESIFQTIDICDDLLIQKTCEYGCFVECEQMQLPSENTLTKTYEAFCSEVNIDFGVKVQLTKNLPAGGGLGGGSSDGASLLKGLADLAGVELTDSLADSVAEKVGSDLFFFLHSGFFNHESGCALVSGRGEIVERIEPRSDLFFLLVFPGIHSSTAEAYSLLDKARKSGGFTACPDFMELKEIYQRSVKSWNFANSFTPVLVQKYPLIGEAIEDVKKCGADWAEMSGSGSTVFGIFESEKLAKKALSECQKKWSCVLVR